MTPQQIEQLEALYQAADKSKWVVDDPKHAHVQTDDYHSIDAGKGYHPEGFGIQSYMSLANAQLIAALHNSWPELKSALEAALSASAPVAPEMDREAWNLVLKASARGMAMLIAYCGAYESLNAYKKSRWNEFAAMNKLAWEKLGLEPVAPSNLDGSDLGHCVGREQDGTEGCDLRLRDRGEPVGDEARLGISCAGSDATQVPAPVPAPAAPEALADEELEACVACLGDDAATLRERGEYEEISHNLGNAAAALRTLQQQNDELREQYTFYLNACARQTERADELQCRLEAREPVAWVEIDASGALIGAVLPSEKESLEAEFGGKWLPCFTSPAEAREGWVDDTRQLLRDIRAKWTDGALYGVHHYVKRIDAALSALPEEPTK